MTIKEIVRRARSVRRFDNSKRIGREALVSMVDTAHYAPSARNGQTLKFVIVDSEQECEALYPSLRWAGYLTEWDGPVESERPVAYIAVVHDKTLGAYNAVDAGLWTQCIVLEATEKGYGTCIIAAMDKGSAVRALSLDTERYELIHIVALGVPKESVVIDEMVDGGIKYWRDEAMVHHVPKRRTEDIIVR